MSVLRVAQALDVGPTLRVQTTSRKTRFNGRWRQHVIVPARCSRQHQQSGVGREASAYNKENVVRSSFSDHGMHA